MKNKRIYFLLAIILLSFSTVHGQETSGGLEGKITDKESVRLGGAVITAIHLPTGTRYQGSADSAGRYHIWGMRIGGPYTITVSRIDMLTDTIKNVAIVLGRNLTLNFLLTDNTRQLNAVTISAAGAIKTNKYGSGANISAKEIKNMPSLTRSIQDVTRLVPQGSKDNSFAGTNFRYNNVTIDGAVNNDAIGFSPSAGGITGSSGMPGSSTRNNPMSLDAIEDIQVYLSPYDVKIGNFTGGSINAVTRSGSNEVTGSIYGFGGNATFIGPDNAGDGKSIPSSYHNIQTGLRVGFPILKNKLFFFTNEEITDRQDPILLSAGSVQEAGVIGLDSAKMIRNYLISKYHFDPGTYDNYNVFSKSKKFFNRIDWNIDDKNQLAVRNNYVWSQSSNLERDQQDFRFSGIDYIQNNTQNSLVAELKSHFNSNWFNTAIVGYTNIHDYRDPVSNPAFPQVQIAGAKPGTTIFLGTDREASIFDLRQKTFEITDNLTWHHGKHTILIGTHNELYDIQYGFVNSWNGRIDYPSVSAFLNNQPIRVRGSYNYTENDRNYIMNNPSALFHVNMLSSYIQDELQVSDHVKFTYGIRADATIIPRTPILSDKTKSALTDPYYGTTYTYTPLSQIHNDYLGWNNIQWSPRIGINWDIKGDQSLVLRGGSGLFTGRIPFAWLGYTFYNNGETYGAFDQRSVNKPFTPGTDPLGASPNGIAAFAASNGQIINNKNAGTTQVDVIDNNFKMPQVWRSSIAFDGKAENGWGYTIEAIYTKTVEDVKFQQVNLKDNHTYYAYDTVSHRQPVYSGNIDPAFANAYELSNTQAGYRYSITAQVSKKNLFGLDVMTAYTYGVSKDISNGIRNSLESNWQLNQALNPNDPQLAYSNFDIRHRVIASINYRLNWNTKNTTNISLFINAQSGAPFTYGFVNTSIQNLGQQVSLSYIPRDGETIRFFQDFTDAGGKIITAAQQAQTFDAYINNNSYLKSRRGDWTERNAAHTPWNTQADLKLSHDYLIAGKHQFTISLDIVNLTALLNSNWGHVYFSPNTFNSTASVGLVPVLNASAQQKINGGYPVYTFVDPGTAYSIDYFASRWQMQFGLRYTF